jgi:hypothetical protein
MTYVSEAARKYLGSPPPELPPDDSPSFIMIGPRAFGNPWAMASI